MSIESDSNLRIFPFDSKTTLSKAIKDYLQTAKDHNERWLLCKFDEYIEKNRLDDHIEDVELEHFDRFLDSLSVSPALRKDYEYRLKPFQRCIGLVEVKVKKNPSVQNGKCAKCPVRLKSEKEVAEAREKITKHRNTIEEMIEEKRKECAQCPKEAAFDKEIEGYRTTILQQESKINTLVSNTGEIEQIKQLQTRKTEIEQEIAKGKKIIENQRFVKLRCDMKSGSIVSFGNDCMHCNDSLSCSKYYELTNPRA